VILAGDIGGTKTILGLFERADGRLALRREETYVSAEHPSLESMIEDFLGAARTAAVGAACFGVAGPVIRGRAKLTNLSWTASGAAVAKLLPAARVSLVNDLQATAFGALKLEPENLHVLNAGTAPPEPANIAVIAAGTGLGQGFLFWDGARYRPAASEGGHADFAPRGDAECELHAFLRRRFGRVSYERILSGAGLENLYAFERERLGGDEPDWLAARFRSGDSAAVVTRTALAREDGACAQALERFCDIYGAEAGNLALKVLALSGVFVAGGIAPRILPALGAGGFMRAFADKGRLAGLLSRIPVKVVLDTRVALIGAAHLALES
jgi:glucokinase